MIRECVFFFQAEDGIRDLVRSRGLGDVYKRQELLLAEIDRGTVDFLPNYDGSATEPQLLPARLPLSLIHI